MAYEGDSIATIYGYHGDFSTVYLVIVSGSFPNFFGHGLLFVPRHKGEKTEGMYFQVVGSDPGVFTAGEFPRMMSNHADFLRYLKENGKTELYRKPFDLSDPAKALAKLNFLASKPRVWWIVVHNCISFVHLVVYAGGNLSFFNSLPSMNYPSVYPPFEDPILLNLLYR